MTPKDYVQWLAPSCILLLLSFYIYDTGGVHVAGIIIGLVISGTGITFYENFRIIEKKREFYTYLKEYKLLILLCWIMSSMILVIVALIGPTFIAGMGVSLVFLSCFYLSVITISKLPVLNYFDYLDGIMRWLP